MLDQIAKHVENDFTDETAAKVLSICRELLKSDHFGFDDNFFDWGGHSLLAMILVLELESRLGLKVSLEKVFSGPTVRELCTGRRDTVMVGPAAVRPLTPGSPCQALYFIHAAFEFTPLCEGLSSDIAASFVSITDREWLRQSMTANDILAVLDRITDAYAEAILSTQHADAFYLAGHSTGGIFAIETARKLEKRGATPDFVFLFDTYLHSSVHRVIHDVLHNGWAIGKLRDLLRDRWRGRPFGPTNGSAPTAKAEAAAVEPTAALSETDFGLMLRDLREMAAGAYRGPGGILACQTVLFQASKRVDGRNRRIDPDLGWARQLEPNLAVMPVSADHFGMVKGEGARRLANEINRLARLPRNENLRPTVLQYQS